MLRPPFVTLFIFFADTYRYTGERGLVPSGRSADAAHARVYTLLPL